MFKLTEDWVITIAAAAAFVVAIALTIGAVVWELDLPPTLIATFLAVAIAALTYRFLGGVGGAQFSVGLLKLGGSAAFLVGLIWFVGDRLREEEKLYSSTSVYRDQIDALEAQLGQAQENARVRQSQINELQRKLAAAPTAQGVYTIEEIKKLPPGDPFIKNLKQLVAGQEGPFRPTVRDLVVRIAVIRIGGETPLYNICEDTLTKLNEGIQIPETRALLSRSSGETGEPLSIIADRNGRIGADVCEAPDRQFDVQINCPIALRLFPEVLATCAEGVKARGMRVSIGALAE